MSSVNEVQGALAYLQHCAPLLADELALAEITVDQENEVDVAEMLDDLATKAARGYRYDGSTSCAIRLANAMANAATTKVSLCDIRWDDPQAVGLVVESMNPLLWVVRTSC